jgi:hypothetical protein
MVGGEHLSDGPMRLEEQEAEKKVKGAVKFIRVPLVIHTVLRRDETFALQIEHVEVKRKSINVPRNILTLKPQEIEEYIKEIYPTARSFVIQYEKKGNESIPFCTQLFISSKQKEP